MNELIVEGKVMKLPLSIAVIFQLLLLTSFVSRQVVLVALFFIFCFYIFFKYYYYTKNLNRKELVFCSLFFIVVYGMTFLKIFDSNVILYHLFVSVVSLFAAIIFTRDVRLYYYASRASLIIFQATILFYVFYKGFDNFPIEVPLENMIKDSSANGITSYSILLQVNFSIISFLLYRKFTFYTSFFTLLIALVSYGRGSILSAFLIIFANIIVYIIMEKKSKIIPFLSIFIVCVYIVISLFWNQISLFFEANTKLSVGFVDDSRSRIIADYLNKINLKTFFFGADYFNTSITNEFNGNPHNSYIRAHHIFGLPYLALVVIAPFILIVNKKRSVVEIIFLLMLILILIFRSFSEPIIAPTLLDFYFVSIVLMLAKVSYHKKPLISKA